MAISAKHQILHQATELHNALTLAQNSYQQMDPLEQLQLASDLSSHSTTLSQLQKRVNDTYLRTEDAIPAISDEELLDISKKLSAADSILNIIQTNYHIAFEVLDLVDQMQEILGNSNRNEEVVRSLNDRVTQMTGIPQINQGNLSLIQSIQHSLSSIARQPQRRTSTPSRESVLSPAPLPPASSEQAIRSQQDENYEATSFVDGITGIKTALHQSTPRPISDFETVLLFYKTVKKYALGKTYYLIAANENKIEHVLSDAESLLVQSIEKQKRLESNQLEQHPSPIALLEELKRAIDALIAESTKSDPNLPKYFQVINDTMTKLSKHHRPLWENFFMEVYNVQKEIGTYPKDRNPVERMKSQSLTMWPGNWENKLTALMQVMQTCISTSADSPSVIEKKADEMQMRFLEVKNAVAPLQSASSSAIETSSNANTRGSSEASAPASGDTVPEILDPIALEGIRRFQTILQLFEENAPIEVLQNAMNMWGILASNEWKVAFKMTSHTPINVGDRPSFHLYWIHKNESPQNLKDDPNYGSKAMVGIYPTSNNERRRAINRTIVELALEGLEDAINFSQPGDVIQAIKILEEIIMEPGDSLPGKSNLAHALFETMYELQREERKLNYLLIDPSDSQFQFDFGRNAFKSGAPGIEPSCKIAAINALRKLLKTAWKL